MFKKKIIDSQERCRLFRRTILKMSQNVSALHIGGTFSSTEILDAIYNILMKPSERENFILSKGHCSVLQYVILNYLGILKKNSLDNYSKSVGELGVHPEINNKKGINASTGSLGHGLAMAAGFALSNMKNTFVVLSDGELQEGSTWESVMAIRNLNLNNIIAVIDNNDLQSLERTSVMHPSMYPIEEKFKSFGWDCKTCNGHDTKKIVATILNRKKNKPFCLVARTIKGYPISFMKNNPIWHYRSPSMHEFSLAMKELE